MQPIDPYTFSIVQCYPGYLHVILSATEHRTRVTGQLIHFHIGCVQISPGSRRGFMNKGATFVLSPNIPLSSTW
jgi:hypothetical protein